MSVLSIPLTEEQIAKIAVYLEKILGEAVNGRTQVERLTTLQICLSEGTNEGYDYVIDLMNAKINENLLFKKFLDLLIEKLSSLKV
jgi:hypothetical protein